MARSTGVDQLEERVIQAAHAALARNRFVSPVDVLVGLGWLPQTRLDEWRQGRVDALETVVSVNLSKVSRSMAVFRRWARQQGLSPSETAYLARTRDRRPLRFSKSGDPEIERAYRTHWVSPKLSERKQERLRERLSRPPDLVVIDPLKDWRCTACGEEAMSGTFLLMEEPGPVCLRCADLDELVFLPSGDAAVSRRAKKASHLAAVVVRFSTSRRRYERQGILCEEAALEQAEEACLADEDARARRRTREEARRLSLDDELGERMTDEILRLFPGCPANRARAIASHTAVSPDLSVVRLLLGVWVRENALLAGKAAGCRRL